MFLPFFCFLLFLFVLFPDFLHSQLSMLSKISDWCISAKLVAGTNTGWLSDFDSSGIRVRMLSEPMKVKAPKSKTHFPGVGAFDFRLCFTWFVSSPNRIRGCLVGQDAFFENELEESFS